MVSEASQHDGGIREQAAAASRENIPGVVDSLPLKPKVSVCLITYNHAHFIAQALNSVLVQRTSFPFEVLVHDDASTDGTTEIIKEYELRYPGLLIPIYQKENQYSKGTRRIMATFVLPKARGEYIALLEGDDYWTDPEKLQLQAGFLDAHPGAALCHHLVTYFDQASGNPVKQFPPTARRVEQCSADLLAEGNFIQTCSLMLRRRFMPELSDGFCRLELGDWPLCVLLGQKGWIGFIDRDMATYRLHGASIWSSQSVAYRLAGGVDMARFLVSQLQGTAQRLWIESLVGMGLAACWEAARDGSAADLARATKQVLASAKQYRKRRLPGCALRCLVIWAEFLRRRGLKLIANSRFAER